MRLRLPRSSNQVRNIKRDHTEAILDSDLTDYFTIEEGGTKVKIKTRQFSAIGIALIFCIKEAFLRAESMGFGAGVKGRPWSTNVFFNKHSYCKNNPTLTDHRSSLMC